MGPRVELGSRKRVRDGVKISPLEGTKAKPQWGRRPGVIAVDLLLLAPEVGRHFCVTSGHWRCLTSPAFKKEESRVLLFVHQAPAVSIA